jgi:hypothetical protein
VAAVFFARGVHRHDVGVMQLGGGFGFAVEALHGLRRQSESAAQDLEGHLAIERQLARFIDDPHAAAADLAHDLEVAQPSADQFRHCPASQRHLILVDRSPGATLSVAGRRGQTAGGRALRAESAHEGLRIRSARDVYGDPFSDLYYRTSIKPYNNGNSTCRSFQQLGPPCCAALYSWTATRRAHTREEFNNVDSQLVATPTAAVGVMDMRPLRSRCRRESGVLP